MKSLGNQTNGFYIESGAYDGETLSNSLYFELQRSYKGQSQISLIHTMTIYIVYLYFKKHICLGSIFKDNICVAGILIEPNIDLYNDMIRKNRDASYINSCLSPTNFTEQYDFVKAYGVSGIKGNTA